MNSFPRCKSPSLTAVGGVVLGIIVVFGATAAERPQTNNSILFGVARIIDGDTLQVASVNVRLEGIDAPERDQTCEYGGYDWPCGLIADGVLRALIRGRPVSCEVTGRDAYGRSLAVCRAGADNLNALMVRSGFALDFRRYSSAYVADEEAAKADHAGMWIGTFIPPWDWRQRGRKGKEVPAGQPLAPAPVPLLSEPQKASPAGLEQPAAGCAIKGNVNRQGERIYHVPGQRDYDRVVMDPAKGKRLFCTEEDATRAGWRRAAR